MNPSLEDYIAYGLKALQERRAFLVDAQQKTTNPLDRLSLNDKISELDVCVKFFADAEKYKSKADMAVAELPIEDK